MGFLRIEIHFVQDAFKILEITARLAHESGQQVMGESDRAFLSIRDNKDNRDLREQSAEQLHLPKLPSARSRKDGDRIRFHGRPEPLPEVIQFLEELYFAFRDHLMNGRFQSPFILIIPA